ncbi:MAG: NAD(P)H-dependent glycerol-3-phosphate dehydrogenase [Rhodothermaceae bacterium]|nr:NAD(P)H-dependent glycerol-3-phosphate dehydrogenase [Rhodothermaceae bacterium]MYG68715.1 NAD(P)H-dependent glycerol-3-phosphate dehydrogenase [Rhodothermaceae bacterium]MYJ45518.1 NAD(P)H-dependent glycerol-3-phosphate dehydrogenase [Rhodothermaceae bacterium]
MPCAISVFGAGSWGTALSVSLSSAGHAVTLWARREDLANAIQHESRNPEYLPDISIPTSVAVTADLTLAAQQASYWVIATPSHTVRKIAADLLAFCDHETTVISVAKGIETETGLTTTAVLASVVSPPIPRGNLVVLYGPSHAEEVGTRKPTTLVAASTNMRRAEAVQEIFMTDRLRIYVNSDVKGVEIGGSVKNIMAIASGISDGVGYGDNARAALITRGIAEIQRLGSALGADPRTFTGLTGLGDLVVTCTSRHSRNRHLGEAIGRGATLGEITKSMNMVAEGVRTTKAVYNMAQRLGIEMPITEAVYGILFEGKQPHDVVQELMTRSAKQEEWLQVQER